jgi:hypothetical protein
VDPNYSGDDRYLATVVRGLRLAREIGQAHALDEWRGYEAQPGPEATDDAMLREYTRRTLAAYNHPVGTCRMGDDALSGSARGRTEAVCPTPASTAKHQPAAYPTSPKNTQCSSHVEQAMRHGPRDHVSA